MGVREVLYGVMAERFKAVSCKEIVKSHHQFKSDWHHFMIKELKKHYGINNAKAINIITYLGIENNTNIKNLPKSKLNTLTRIINFLKNQGSIDLTLKKKIKTNIKKKITINCLVGKRHKLKYPVKGQRTRCNASTAKKRPTL